MEIKKLTYGEDTDRNARYHIWPTRDGKFYLTGTQIEGLALDDTYGPFPSVQAAKDFAATRRDSAQVTVYKSANGAASAVRIGRTSGASGWDGTPDNWKNPFTGIEYNRRTPANKFRFGWGGLAEYAGDLDA
jgi:hypothetical protein